jgi:hypothetical protein
MVGKSKQAKYCKPACRHKAWKVRNPDKVKTYQRTKEELRDSWYRTKYGITLEDYNQMFADQNGCCAICGVHQVEVKTRLAVDHCHETGVVRGLLCKRCNMGLGYFDDCAENLAKAIIYLQENNDEQ